MSGGDDAMRNSKFVYDKNRKLFQSQITEEHVLKEIVIRLWVNKINTYRVRERIPGMSKNLSTPGIPDLMGWYKRGESFGPIPLFIECKRPGGVRRPAQIAFIEDAKADGCIAFFAESWIDCVKEFGNVGIILRTT